MQFKNSFMQLYEELSKIQESIQNRETIDSNLIDQLNTLKNVYSGPHSTILAKRVTHCLPAVSEAVTKETQSATKVSLARVVTDSSKNWNYIGLVPTVNAKGKLVTLNQARTKCNIAIDENKVLIDTIGSWLCYGVTFRGGNNINYDYIKVNYPNETKQLIKDILAITGNLDLNKVFLATGYKSNDTSNLTVCVPFDSAAKPQTLNNYYSIVEPATVLTYHSASDYMMDAAAEIAAAKEPDGKIGSSNVIDFSAKKTEIKAKNQLVNLNSLSTENIQAFLVDYMTNGKFFEATPLTGLVLPEDAYAITSFSEFFSSNCFHAPSLVQYYKEKCATKNHTDLQHAATAADIIKKYYHCAITGQGSSLQYLTNAIQQERIIAKECSDVLRHNDAATKASGVSDYAHEYLVPNGVTSDADFLYQGDELKRDANLIAAVTRLSNVKVPMVFLKDVTTMKPYFQKHENNNTSSDRLDPNSVDAKIFNNDGSWKTYCCDPKVTKAKYIIAYFFESKTWRLFKQKTRGNWETLASTTSSSNNYSELKNRIIA